MKKSNRHFARDNGSDIASYTILVRHVVKRKTVADIDIDLELRDLYAGSGNVG